MRGLERLYRRPVSVIAWAAALVVAGAASGLHTPVEWVPETELPQVTVEATWPGSGPRAIERHVVAPLERMAAAVSGAGAIESVSWSGRGVVMVEIGAGTDPDVYVAELAERAAGLERSAPAGVRLAVRRDVPAELRSEQGFMTLLLAGAVGPAELRAVADGVVAPALVRVHGVSGVAVQGGAKDEVVVVLDDEALERHAVSVRDVEEGLRDALDSRPLGLLRDGVQNVALATRPVVGERALGEVIVGEGGPPVRVADVATLAVRAAPTDGVQRLDGEPVVTLEVSRAPSRSLVPAAAAVEAAVGALRERLPPGVRLLVVEDKSASARRLLRDLSWQAPLGVALVLVVLLEALRSLSAAAAVVFGAAAAIGVALVLALLVGLSLNAFSLAGLVVTFGLLVDNGVVVAERVAATSAYGQPVRLRAAVADVATPLLGGTLSTLIVLIPVVYLSGELRAVFVPLALVLGAALTASVATAVVVVPVCLRPPRAGAPVVGGSRRGAHRAYRPAVAFPRATLAAGVALVGLPLFALPDAVELPPGDGPAARAATLYNAVLGTPAVREPLDVLTGGLVRPFLEGAAYTDGLAPPPEVRLTLRLPPGGTPAQAAALAVPFEALAVRASGAQRTLTTAAPTDDYGAAASVRVRIAPGASRSPGPYRLREAFVRRAAQLGGADAVVSGLGLDPFYASVGRQLAGVRLHASGADYDALDAQVEAFAARLSRSGRVAAVHRHTSPLAPQQPPPERVRVAVHPGAAGQAGVLRGGVLDAVAPRLRSEGERLSPVAAGQPPVRLVLRSAERSDLRDIVDRTVRVNDSTRVRLGEVAAVERGPAPGAIVRRDQQYARALLVDYVGTPEMATRFIEQEIEASMWPPGYAIERAYATPEGDERAALLALCLAAVVLVGLAVASVLESWGLAGAVLTSLGAAVVGVAATFLLLDLPLSRGAGIGAVVLTGLAVNDAVLLAAAMQRVATRARPAEAVALLALRGRIRPMWLTTTTSVASLLPVLVLGEGAFWTGFAAVIVGGLVGATALGPALLMAAVCWRRPRAWSRPGAP